MNKIKFTEAENYKNIPEIIVLILDQESFEVVEEDSEREDFENYEHEFTFWKAKESKHYLHLENRIIEITLSDALKVFNGEITL